ncbi:MAG: Maf family protein [Deltaproteobacteria bacterium]|jgi:septum formation protein|nr:Maf family protein [Deltaproteobacteria bacterium]
MSDPSVPELILASASPRRRELLRAAGFQFIVKPAEVDESPIDQEPPRAQVSRLAVAKALAGAKENPQSLVLAADTIVVLKGQIFGKPKELAEAKEMLKALSGQTHEVITAFCLLGKNCPKPIVKPVSSAVTFRPLNASDIEAYLALGESLDKAGAYAVQGLGLSLIKEIQGSLTNVMGLPLQEVIVALEKYLGPRT